LKQKERRVEGDDTFEGKRTCKKGGKTRGVSQRANLSQGTLTKKQVFGTKGGGRSSLKKNKSRSRGGRNKLQENTKRGKGR